MSPSPCDQTAQQRTVHPDTAEVARQCSSHGSNRRTALPVAPPPPPPSLPHGAMDSPSLTHTDSIMSQSKMFAESQWQKAYTMLESNPNLMTGGILAMALRRRAPLKLICFMLKLNPEAASIPKKGPSPLQIAVQSQCSTEVIEELVKVCPFALVATNPGSHLDPLSYAKRFRPAEDDLIRLLSHPVNHWITRKHHKDLNGELLSVVRSYKPVHRDPKHPAISKEIVPPFLRYTCGSNEDVADTSYPLVSDRDERNSPSVHHDPGVHHDPSEINNVKLICLATLKGHKRLNLQMLALQSQFDKVTNASSAAFESASSLAREQVQLTEIKKALQTHSLEMWQKATEQQAEVERRHLASIEMQDQSLRIQMEKAESQILEAVETYRGECAASLEVRLNAITQRLESQMSAFNHRIDCAEHRVFEIAAPVLTSGVGRSALEIHQRNQPTTIGSRDLKHSNNENPHPRWQNRDYPQHRRQNRDYRPPQQIQHHMSNKKKPDPIIFDTARHWTAAMDQVALVSPESFTYRDSPTLATMTDCDGDDGSPMPFVFADPFQRLLGDADDVRSLLTDNSQRVDRGDLAQHTRGSRRAAKVSKKLMLVLCKNY